MIYMMHWVGIWFHRGNNQHQIRRTADNSVKLMAHTHEPAHVRPRVLVVDDSPVIRQVAVLQLARFAVDVDYAANGKEALRLFERHSFSLVLMDIQMPEMDGLEATRQMRALEKGTGRHTPIVAITASDTKQHCLAAGMDDYITKPADYVRAIKRWLPKAPSKSA
jgi:CheY-like chemotaxis protein